MADGESKAEKLDRELKELTDELRVALPGVQVLFAFLLTVPFTSRFEDVSELQQDAFFASFLCATASSICLIAPSVMHRIQWRQPRQGAAAAHREHAGARRRDLPRASRSRASSS